MELMAPAGSLKSFLACIESGADSIYLGVKKFNARMPADNFTFFTLKKAVEYAHLHNINVYLTLNIDLKSNELKEVCCILEYLKSIKIDGVIVKDPAVIYIINNFYKENLNIHLSTQCAISSSYGVKFAKSIGTKRVVLARELELKEIEEACKVKNIECEVFTEGSMCFSVSGRCLMSSWIGGRSGNRGLCTAPCRVLWESSASEKNFFSMKDMSLINYLNDLKKANVSSLKIEGRLKSPYWVKQIVSVYKSALNNQTIEKLYEQVKKYSAREVDSGHLLRHNNLVGKNEEWDAYKKQDEFIISSNFFTLNNEIIIDHIGDKIIVDFLINEKREKLEIKINLRKKKAKLHNIVKIVDELKINEIKDFKVKITIKSDDLLLSSSALQNLSKSIINKLKVIINKEEISFEVNHNVMKFITPARKEQNRKKILGDYPDKVLITLNQTEILNNLDLPIDTFSVYLDNLSHINMLDRIRNRGNIIISLPALIYENDILRFEEAIRVLSLKGFENFEANSYTGIQILKNINCNKFLGIDMAVLNHLAADFFYSNGISSLYSSIEADMSSLKALSNFTQGRIECLVFGKIKLFITRVQSEYFENGLNFMDKYKTNIECHKDGCLNLFISGTPLSFVDAKFKKENISFDSLTADLRFFNYPKKILNDIFNNNYNSGNSSQFNLLKKLI
ncbi:MAG: U32 family peptidase [Spirochaetes bacterium]|nr:U32 family peptidase [Spirochaetota bacterium]